MPDTHCKPDQAFLYFRTLIEICQLSIDILFRNFNIMNFRLSNDSFGLFILECMTVK